jgi:hypothetical protein
VRLEKHLNISAAGAKRMHQSLKHGDTVLRPIAFPAESGERQTVGCAIGQIETAVAVETFVRGIFQPDPSGPYQAVELVT